MKNNDKILMADIEIELIEIARKVGADPNFWDSEELSEIKKKIKAYLKEKNNDRCSYCRRSIKGDHNMTLDIEHIVEKDVAPRLSLTLDNLAISCRRCNFKKNTIKSKDAYTTLAFENEFRNSFTYNFVHPNIDDYYKYIIPVGITVKDYTLIKYFPLPRPGVPSPEKAWFTYECFDLKEYERFDIMKFMKIRKPNTILAVENPNIQQYLADQLEKSHALKKKKQQERAAEKKSRS